MPINCMASLASLYFVFENFNLTAFMVSPAAYLSRLVHDGGKLETL